MENILERILERKDLVWSVVSDNDHSEPIREDALVGFMVCHVEPAPSLDGVTVLYGYYPAIGAGQIYAIGIYFDEAFNTMRYCKERIPEQDPSRLHAGYE